MSVLANLSQDERLVCSQPLGSPGPQTHRIPASPSVGALISLDTGAEESPLGFHHGFGMLEEGSPNFSPPPPQEARNPPPPPRQFDECVLANCVKDTSPLASVTTLLFNQSQAPRLACERGGGVALQKEAGEFWWPSQRLRVLGGHGAAPTPFEGNLLCSTSSVNLIVKAPFSFPLFFKIFLLPWYKQARRWLLSRWGSRSRVFNISLLYFC